MGIIFNTRDVWACLAEVERSISNSVGIIFNTRVAEGCRPQFGVPPPIMRVLFLIPVMCVASQSGGGVQCSVGIIFNIRDVCSVAIGGGIQCSVGIIFNTRVSEGCRPQFGVPPIVRVLFLIPVWLTRLLVLWCTPPKIAWVLILMPVMC